MRNFQRFFILHPSSFFLPSSSRSPINPFQHPGVSTVIKERIVEALSLTQEEQSKLAEMHSANRETVQKLRDEMREERQALRGIFQSEGFSSSDAKKHFQEAERNRSRLNKERFELQIQQRQLLGQERFAKLRKMDKRAMEKRRDNRPRRSETVD